MRQAKDFLDTKARAEPGLWPSVRESEIRPESRKVYPAKQPGVFPGDDNDGHTNPESALVAVSVTFAVSGLVALPVLALVLVFVPEFIAETAIGMLVA